MQKYKKRAKLCALLLLFAVLFTSCASGNVQPNSEQEDVSAVQAQSVLKGPQTFTLPYFSVEGFNPYLANNLLLRQLSGLLYMPMVTISPQMQLENKALKTLENQGFQVVLQPESDLCFADGSKIQAEDIAASLQAAMTSPAYLERFANVRSVRVEKERVLVQLKQEDGLFAYLLDIPVLKKSDVQEEKPTPSGRYTHGGDGLVLNKQYKEIPILPFEEIVLYPVSGYDNLRQAFTTGDISLFANEEETNPLGATVALVETYPMNNLVFMGTNGGRSANRSAQPLLSTPEGRKLISSLLDREELSVQSFGGMADPAHTALNPLYGLAEHPKTQFVEQTISNVQEQLKLLGYKKSEQGIGMETSYGEGLSLRLLCYAGSPGKREVAMYVADVLQEYGIQVELLQEENFEEYLTKIAAGEFELYIGEVKLYNNMDLSCFFDGGSVSTHLYPSNNLRNAWQAFNRNSKDAAAFEQAFADEMPYLPLLWRQGTVLTAKNVSGVNASVSDIFYEMSKLALEKQAEK